MTKRFDIHLPDIGDATDAADWPVVGFVSCIKYTDGVPYHSLATQYVPPVTDSCRCLPMQIPLVGDRRLIAAILDRVSGIVLPGSTSNVDPERFGQPRTEMAAPFDPTRDATVFPMIEMALERGLPLLAICRGLQELNVARGGTIHPQIHTIQGRLDHRAPDVDERDEMFRPAHPVALSRDSILRKAGFADRFDVCSLHGQGIDRLGDGLMIDAVADDGTIEAITMPEARGFVLGVQWHPEYLHHKDPHSVRIFRMFARAVAAYARDKTPLPLPEAV